MLPSTRRNLTGRRQSGGTFAGYAAPGLEFPKTPQRVSYVTRREGQGGADAAAPRGEIAALRSRSARPRRDRRHPARVAAQLADRIPPAPSVGSPAAAGRRRSRRRGRRRAPERRASVAVMPLTARNSAEFDAPAGMTAVPVVLAPLAGRLHVLLVRRDEPPDPGAWALPGGFMSRDERPEETAQRKLTEKTGVGAIYLEQLQTYGDPHRDPRGWIPTVAYLAPDRRRGAACRRGPGPLVAGRRPAHRGAGSGGSSPTAWHGSAGSSGGRTSVSACSPSASPCPRPGGSSRPSAACATSPATSGASWSGAAWSGDRAAGQGGARSPRGALRVRLPSGRLVAAALAPARDPRACPGGGRAAPSS